MDRPIAIETDDIEWEPTTIEGLEEKVLWRNPETEASIIMLKFAAGSGITRAHHHPSNQFFFCLSGRYLDEGSGITSGPGTFYWNPTGVEHGPTKAIEETILIEIYDGRHYD